MVFCVNDYCVWNSVRLRKSECLEVLCRSIARPPAQAAHFSRRTPSGTMRLPCSQGKYVPMAQLNKIEMRDLAKERAQKV